MPRLPSTANGQQPNTAQSPFTYQSPFINQGRQPFTSQSPFTFQSPYINQGRQPFTGQNPFTFQSPYIASAQQPNIRNARQPGYRLPVSAQEPNIRSAQQAADIDYLYQHNNQTLEIINNLQLRTHNHHISLMHKNQILGQHKNL